MIFLAHESITAIKHLQVIVFPQLHLYNSIVRRKISLHLHLRNTAGLLPLFQWNNWNASALYQFTSRHTNPLSFAGSLGGWVQLTLPVDLHRIWQDNLFFLNLVVNCCVTLHCSFVFIAFPDICSGLMRGLLLNLSLILQVSSDPASVLKTSKKRY